MAKAESCTQEGGSGLEQMKNALGAESVRIKAIIFDWSGVISDDFGAVYDTNARMLKRLGVKAVSRDEFRERFDPTYMDFFRSVGVLADEKTLDRMFAEEFEKSAKRPRVFPFAKATLKWIRGQGVKAAVLSAHPEKFLRAEIKEYGLSNYFSVVVGSAADKSDHIGEVIEKLGVRKEEIVYAGDMTHDIDTGKKAGVITAAVLSGYHGREKLLALGPQIIMNDIRAFKYVLGGVFFL
jgi:phosphoglycolate phosphatase-like HAD superfamily hydrolase